MFIDLINRPPVGGEPFQMGRISDPCNLCWAGAPEWGYPCRVAYLNREFQEKHIMCLKPNLKKKEILKHILFIMFLDKLYIKGMGPSP